VQLLECWDGGEYQTLQEGLIYILLCMAMVVLDGRMDLAGNSARIVRDLYQSSE